MKPVRGRLTALGQRPWVFAIAAIGIVSLAVAEATTPVQLSSLDGRTGARFYGQELENSGWSVAAAGDINGDGIDDVVIGAPYTSFFTSRTGAAYVVFGRSGGFASPFDLSGLDGTNGFRVNGIGGNDNTGLSVAGAGDVNADGVDDVIIGAPYANSNGAVSGSSYVVFGTAAGFAPELELSDLDGASGFRIDGAAAGDQSGTSVAAAGDFNGDGIDDFILGAEGSDHGGPETGSAYIVLGRNSGFAAVVDLATLDATTGLRLDGSSNLDYTGRSVAAAGDVNGDAIDDVIVGAFGADANGRGESGSSFVVFGRATGAEPSLSLGSLDGSTGFRIDGEAPKDRSAISVDGAGDVNRDGFDDLIIGADLADHTGDGAGSSYVVFGRGGPFPPALDLATLNGTAGFRIDGEAASDASGVSVAGAEDVNGDGIDDILIGAFGADPNGSASGSSYVLFGSTTPFPAVLKLSELDARGFRLDGPAELELSGFSVAGAGDVNNDGTSDLIIGAPYGASNTIFSGGSSYVVFGADAEKIFASGFED